MSSASWLKKGHPIEESERLRCEHQRRVGVNTANTPMHGRRRDRPALLAACISAIEKHCILHGIDYEKVNGFEKDVPA
jgi:hypothetical protein